MIFFETSPTRGNWRFSLPRWCTKYKEVFKKRIALKFALCAQDATMRPVISARCRRVGCFAFSGLWTWWVQWKATIGRWENCKMGSQFLVPWVKKNQLCYCTRFILRSLHLWPKAFLIFHGIWNKNHFLRAMKMERRFEDHQSLGYLDIGQLASDLLAPMFFFKDPILTHNSLVLIWFFGRCFFGSTVADLHVLNLSQIRGAQVGRSAETNVLVRRPKLGWFWRSYDDWLELEKVERVCSTV